MTRTDNILNMRAKLLGEIWKGMIPIEASEKGTFERFRDGKKRNHKIMITDEANRKVSRIKLKNIPESEYNTIRELAGNVLRISKDENNSNEVAITYGQR